MPPQSTQVGLAFHILIYIEVEGQKQKALWKRFQSRQALTLCSRKMPAARAPGRRPSGRDFSLVCTSVLSGLIANLELVFVKYVKKVPGDFLSECLPSDSQSEETFPGNDSSD